MSLSTTTITIATRLRHQHRQIRTFIDVRIKWVPDRYLDNAVSVEKNLKQVLSLKHQILSSPSKTLPLSSLSLLKPHLNLPTTSSKFFQNYPTLFTVFQPCPSLPLHVKLTPGFAYLHKQECEIHNSQSYRNDAVKRLAKLLMLTGSMKLPFYVIDKFKLDLGLPYNYLCYLLADYPEYFDVCSVIDCVTNKETLALELLNWRNALTVSEMERRVLEDGNLGVKKGMRVRFSMNLPKGFDLQKKVLNWVDEFQDLPYVSPYENAFHLRENSDQAEKWAVAVLHELLWLLVSKKTERENVFCLGEYLGFGDRFSKVLKHHPGIFYVSNKIRTQTVILREAYRKSSLMEKHPLIAMRYKYIRLMNKLKRRRKPVVGHGDRRKVALDAPAHKGKNRLEDGDIWEREESDSDSEFEDIVNEGGVTKRGM